MTFLLNVLGNPVASDISPMLDTAIDASVVNPADYNFSNVAGPTPGNSSYTSNSFINIPSNLFFLITK